jgi:hypothetical protein
VLPRILNEEIVECILAADFEDLKGLKISSIFFLKLILKLIVFIPFGHKIVIRVTPRNPRQEKNSRSELILKSLLIFLMISKEVTRF